MEGVPVLDFRHEGETYDVAVLGLAPLPPVHGWDEPEQPLSTSHPSAYPGSNSRSP